MFRTAKFTRNTLTALQYSLELIYLIEDIINKKKLLYFNLFSVFCSF